MAGPYAADLAKTFRRPSVRAFAGNVDHNRPADEAPHKIVSCVHSRHCGRLPVYHASAWRACALGSPELAPDPGCALRKVRQRDNDHDDDKQPCGYLFFDPDPLQHRTSLWRGKSRAGDVLDRNTVVK
jgi:hypothetical protein